MVAFERGTSQAGQLPHISKVVTQIIVGRDKKENVFMQTSWWAAKDEIFVA